MVFALPMLYPWAEQRHLGLELDIHFMSDDSRKMDDSDEDFDGEQQCC